VGNVNGSFAVRGDGSAIHGSTRLGIREVDWKGGHVDSATVVLSLENRSLNLEYVDALVGGGRIHVAGDITLPRPLMETIHSLRDSVPLDGEQIALNLTATASRLDLPQWRFLLPNRERVAGTIGAVVRVEGTAADPRLEVDGESDDLVWKHFDAERLVFRGGFAGGTVRVDTLETWQHDRKLEVSGTFPLDLALVPFAFGVPERPMDIRVRSDEGSLSSLRLTPWIRSAEGKLQAEARFEGTPRNPLITGYATVDAGAVELKERDEVLTDITARIRFEGDLVRVEQAEARMILPWNAESGRNSTVTAEGTYRLGAAEEETYALTIRLKDALVGEEGVYAARITGEVNLTPLRGADGKIYPFAKGTVFVSRAEYAGSLEPQDIGEFKSPSLLYDIVLNAPSKILVRTEGVDAELGGENLTVRQTPDRQEIVGDLEILRGSYPFFQKTFRVIEGTLSWDDPTTRLPNMDISAETTEVGYIIRVNLTGRPGNLRVLFSAERDGVDAELTQGEIITLLTVGATGLGALGVTTGVEGTTGTGSQSGREEALQTVGSLFLNQVERELARQIGIVDAVELKTESGEGDFEPIVGVTKYITPEINIQYEQGLSNTHRQNLEVEYRLGRILFLRGSVIRLPDNVSQDQEYNLDLKIRKEY
jgi:autotransporter translocation and assembly factor TamB